MNAGDILRIMKALPECELEIIKLAKASSRHDGTIDYEKMTRDHDTFNRASIQARDHADKVRETTQLIVQRIA